MTQQPLESDPTSPDLRAVPVPQPLQPLAPIDGPSAAEAAARDGSDSAVVPGGTLDAGAGEAPDLDPADSSLLHLIDRLASILERTDLTELEVQVGSTGLVLRKPSAIAPPLAVAGTVPAAGAASADASAQGSEAGAPSRPSVKAPLSGIWYGSPAPGSAPYVTVGGEVAVGQVIGLIEAMKLFNEIKSDLAGRVVKMNAENGKLVRAKQPLIEVEPL
jgi:acetyl-CoA carboxylase biotin carboxyl carrier protein